LRSRKRAASETGEVGRGVWKKGIPTMTEPPDLGLATVTNALSCAPARRPRRLIMAGAPMRSCCRSLLGGADSEIDRFYPFGFSKYGDLFFVATLSALVIFAVSGLYRAIIRFHGPARHGDRGWRAWRCRWWRLRDTTGVGAPNMYAVVLAIYAALALVYLAKQPRFISAHGVFTRENGAAAKRVAIYGAGESGARLSSASSAAGFSPVAFIDGQAIFARAAG